MHDYIARVTKIIEANGLLIILIGLLYALGMFIRDLLKKTDNCYGRLRKALGKSILLGLELLIAVAMVVTVVTITTIESVSILAILVLLRTVLNVTIQVENESKFDWQSASNDKLHD